MKIFSIIFVAVLVVSTVSADVDTDKFKTFLRGPKVMLKKYTPTKCEIDDDCGNDCTCQDFELDTKICFSDPIFESTLGACTPCYSENDCPEDTCFIPEDISQGFCDKCINTAMEAGLNECGENLPLYPSPISSPSAAPASTSPVSEPIVAEPTPSETAEVGNSILNSVCFPHDAQVTLEDGSRKMIKDVEIDDKIQTGHNRYSAVFSFTHRDSSVTYRFVELTTGSGRKVQLTGSHFIYVNGTPTAAKNVEVGDELMGDDGKVDVVASIRSVSNTGLYNPQTIDGDIAVGGILSSTYTDAVQFETAHSLLAPLRMLYNICGVAPLNSEKSLI